MDFEKLLETIQVKHPARIIREIVEYRKNHVVPGTAEPIVTLFSDKGFACKGHLIAIGEDSGKEIVVLRHVADRLISEEICYLLLSDIGSVRVDNSLSVAPVLFEGKIPDVTNTSPPSRLEISRRMVALSERLKQERKIVVSIETDWQGIPDTGNVCLAIDKYLEMVYRSLSNSARDEIGRETWKKFARFILRHIAGQAPRLTKQPGVIILETDFEGAIPLSTETYLNDQLNRIL